MEMDLGELGFWLFLAAVGVAFIIAGVTKHNAMLRLIQASIEKSGTVDPKLAELLERESERKAQADAWVWGRPAPGTSPRKVVGGLLGGIGGFVGFIAFVILISQYTGDGPLVHRGVLEGLLIALGAGGAVAAVFGLIGWLIWPKSEKSSDEPLV